MLYDLDLFLIWRKTFKNFIKVIYMNISNICNPDWSRWDFSVHIVEKFIFSESITRSKVRDWYMGAIILFYIQEHLNFSSSYKINLISGFHLFVNNFFRPIYLFLHFESNFIDEFTTEYQIEQFLFSNDLTINIL